MRPPSPHYSPKRNPFPVDPRRDGRLQAALDAIRLVAAADPDHARDANGRGFAKSDVHLGHSLARTSAASLGAAAAAEAVRLAVRYRRQVSTSLRYALHLTDQPDLFD